VILLQESATKAPSQPEIQFHLGMACYAMAQEAPARTALKRALELAPNFSGRDEALDRLSIIEMDISRADQTIVAKLQERIRKQPNDVLAQLQLGKVYEQMGMTAKAVQVIENARKLSPASVPVLAQLAQLYSKSQKDSQQALALAREARKLAPNDPAIAHVLGRLAYQAGDHAWACSLLQESATKQPGDPELLLDLAHANYSIGRTEEAEQTARRALQTGGTFAREKETQWLLALIGFYKNPNERVQAEAQVQQSLKTTPDYLPALMVAGLIHEQQGRAAEARLLYERILSRYPLFVPAARQLAIHFAASAENDKKAYALAQQAREAYPRDPEVSKALGILTHRQGDNKRAVQLLSEAAEKKSGDPEVFYYLGMAHCSLKQQKEGENALRRALSLQLKNPHADEARRTLANLQTQPGK
jgi:Flp pilus assembly protein TadD